MKMSEGKKMSKIELAIKTIQANIEGRGLDLWKLRDAEAILLTDYAKAKDLLRDLNEILPTALHNGHHDLIQRVKEICK